MRKIIFILALFMAFGCSTTDVGKSSRSSGYLMHNFEKPFHWMFGENVKIAAYDKNGIAFVYREKSINNLELEAAGKEHCNNYNKEVVNRQRSFYQKDWASIIFRCR